MSDVMWYCYRVDKTRCTPELVNELWRREHNGTPIESCLRVISATHGGEALPWWRCNGGGNTIVDPGEDALDEAVFRFLVEHADLFDRLWYGSIIKTPDDIPERTLGFFETTGEVA